MRALFPATAPVSRRGFSLVEVALAVGVLSVALVALFGLLPSGLNGFQKAMDTSISAQIAQRVLDDAQQAEFDELVDRANLPADPLKQGFCPERFSFRAPSIDQPAWRYFDVEGTEILPKNKKGKLTPEEKIGVVYQVNTRIRPRAEMPAMREGGAQVAQVTVQVARNPELAQLYVHANDELPEHNLIKPDSAVPVFTYSGLIGRNQGR